MDREKDWIEKLRINAARGPASPITRRQIGLVARLLADATGWGDNGRHTFLRLVFGKKSTTDLTMGEAGAILDWIIAIRDPVTKEYILDATAVSQMSRLLDEENRKLGQMQLPIEVDVTNDSNE